MAAGLRFANFSILPWAAQGAGPFIAVAFSVGIMDSDWPSLHLNSPVFLRLTCSAAFRPEAATLSKLCIYTCKRSLHVQFKLLLFGLFFKGSAFKVK